MSDQNEQVQGVFGGVKLDNNNETTSYFENGCQGNVNVEPENKNDSIFGNFQGSENGNQADNFQPIAKEKAITQKGLWSRIKEFLFQEIDLYAPITVELTPYQQKVENELNEFLHQEITFKGIGNFFKGKK